MVGRHAERSAPGRRFRKSRAPVLLGIWAFAPPVVLQEGPDGGLTLSVGAAAGEYEVVSRSCAGDLIDAESTPARSVGVQVEYETSRVRLGAFGGVISADDPIHEGEYLGALAAWEGASVGVGFGAARLPGDETLPAIYLRFGRRDGTFFQADLAPPGPTPGVTGLARAGIGVGIGGTRALLGVSAGRPLDPGFSEPFDNGGPFAQFDIPVGPNLGLHAAGSLFVPERQADWSIGAGLRWRTGR